MDHSRELIEVIQSWMHEAAHINLASHGAAGESTECASVVDVAGDRTALGAAARSATATRLEDD